MDYNKRIIFYTTKQIWFFLYSEKMEMLRIYLDKQTEEGINIRELCSYCKNHGIMMEACTKGGDSRNPFYRHTLGKVQKLIREYGIGMSDEAYSILEKDVVTIFDRFANQNVVE